MQWSLRFSSLTLFSDWYSSNHVLRGSGIRSGEVEMRIVEDSNTKANTISIIATDAVVPQPRNQKRRRMSNLLPSTVTLFANPRVVIALWGCFGQVSPLCGCDAVVPIFVKRTFGHTIEAKSAPSSPSRSPTPCRFKHSHLGEQREPG